MTDNEYHNHIMDCAKILLTEFIKDSEKYTREVFWDCVKICKDIYDHNKGRLDT